MKNGKNAETQRFVKVFSKEIAEYALRKNKSIAAKEFNISIGAVDSALYREGYKDRCSNWYLRMKKDSEVLRQFNKPKKKYTERLIKTIHDSIVKNGSEKILEALGELFIELKTLREQLDEKNTTIIALRKDLEKANKKLENVNRMNFINDKKEIKNC